MRLAIAAATGLLKAHISTLRITIVDECGTLDEARARPMIFCFWHNRMLLAPSFHVSHLHPREGVVLTSASRDGAVLEAVAKQFGLRAVRGSSSRRGTPALLELIKSIKDGCHLGITPDGPRGPKYRFAPGALLVAQKAAAPIVPLHFDIENAWRLKSWDSFMIPKPFSRVRITVGKPVPVPADLDEHAFESHRSDIERTLLAPVADSPGAVPPAVTAPSSRVS
jgi:lysophospholipid acyltransferase (LPLAT)-like uncharacterized protein